MIRPHFLQSVCHKSVAFCLLTHVWLIFCLLSVECSIRGEGDLLIGCGGLNDNTMSFISLGIHTLCPQLLALFREDVEPWGGWSLATGSRSLGWALGVSSPSPLPVRCLYSMLVQGVMLLPVLAAVSAA